jgi:hypothetical protein
MDPYTRGETAQGVIELIPDALHVLRRVLDGGPMGAEACRTARWVVEKALDVLGDEGESADVLELRAVLEAVRK